jgi:hypothetical protein
MLTQEELWQHVEVIKKHVIHEIGRNLTHEFRSTQIYQAYTAMCGECQMAFEDKELNEDYINQLENQANQVIDLFKKMRS